MKRSGFTLIELLAVIVLLGIVLAIAIPTISNIISSTKNNVYVMNEKMLVNAAKNYMYSNNLTFPSDIGETITIQMNDLKESKILDIIKDPNNNEECNGYVTIEKVNETDYSYKSYIKCGTNYVTEGYVEEPTYPTNGLVLHLDATAITGLNDGDRISQWNDLSGNGNNLTQSNSNYQPSYRSNGWNGQKAAVQSSLSRADRMVNNNIQTNINRTTGVTIFTVMNIPSNQSGGIYELSSNIDTVNDGISLIPWGTTMYSRGPIGATTSDITYTYVLNKPMILTQRFAPDSGPNAELTLRHCLWENGILKGSQNPTWDNRYYNTLVLITLTGNGQYGRDALIAEFLIYNRALSDTERQQVEQYLNTKWLE